MRISLRKVIGSAINISSLNAKLISDYLLELTYIAYFLTSEKGNILEHSVFSGGAGQGQVLW